MKVSINSKFIDGPFGGGMQFANYMYSFLKKEGVTTINHLNDSDIDIILHVNPFPYLTSASVYSYRAAYAYKLSHPQAKIIERVNECDERKKTHHINREIIKAIDHSDYTVYISSWLKQLFEDYSEIASIKPSSVILNGADEAVFKPRKRIAWSKNRPLKVVTHHWSAHEQKGHDIYRMLDNLLSEKEIKSRFEFTYIGNLPEHSPFKNTRVIGALSGAGLAKELQRHDVYVTGTQNEPAGMHHIEGAMCGLPLLYRSSGALPEYCKDFGIEFDEDSFTDGLNDMYLRHNEFAEKMKKYNNTADKMARQYLWLMRTLHQQTTSPDKPKLLKAKFYKAYDTYTRKLHWRIKKYFL
jgi:hypothetical protein